MPTTTKKKTQDTSLDVYWGGLLLNGCIPLELSLNWCSHNCAYCFANLNDPDRKANWEQIYKLLAELWQTNAKGEWKRQSYAAHLLREGYPVHISNHVDLLASSNAHQGLKLLETLRGMNIPVTLATRFGKPKETGYLFDLLKGTPSSIYSSIPTMLADVARKVEPGAPTPEERLEYIQTAVSHGHSVRVGINPVVPDWIPDVDAHVSAIAQAGAYGISTQLMHLSSRQVERMPARSRAAMGEAIVQAAMPANRTRDTVGPALLDEIAATAKQYGLDIYLYQKQREVSQVFEPYKARYKKLFPTLQDFINHCHATKQAGEAIYFEEFWEFYADSLPRGVWGLRDHLNAIAFGPTLYGLGIPQRMTYRRLFYYIWKHPQTIYCPANSPPFAFAGEPIPDSNNQWIELQDDDGLPILIWVPDGTPNIYTDQHGIE